MDTPNQSVYGGDSDNEGSAPVRGTFPRFGGSSGLTNPPQVAATTGTATSKGSFTLGVSKQGSEMDAAEAAHN